MFRQRQLVALARLILRFLPLVERTRHESGEANCSTGLARHLLVAVRRGATIGLLLEPLLLSEVFKVLQSIFTILLLLSTTLEFACYIR